MGQFLFHLPDVGEGVAEAEIVVWHVQPGDRVREDQSLVDVMTDKATVDMTSPVDGVVTAIHGEVGDMRAVGSVLVEIEIADEGDGETAPAPASPVPVIPNVPPAAAAAVPNTAPLAAPATRLQARERGIDLHDVTGTGPDGRITPDDLDAHGATAVHAQPPAGLVARTGVSDTRIIGLRRKIGERMQEAKRRIPHIAYVEECDVTELEALRQTLNADKASDQPKLTLLPFFMLALVRALLDFPQINSRYDDDAGILHSFAGVHIGIATQTPDGLMVPVVRHAEARDIWQLAGEMARVTAAARNGGATRDELSGSTITLTSLGTLGGVVSTPVINHPEVAIINPNKIVDRPTVQGSFVTVRKMMNLSSSFDHRIVDGFDAASFIQRVKRMLEHPALLFMGR